MVSRLLVYPAGWKSRRGGQDECKPDDCDGGGGTVARGELDIHALGIVAWRGARSEPVLAEAWDRYSEGGVLGNDDGGGVGRVDFFPRDVAGTALCDVFRE